MKKNLLFILPSLGSGGAEKSLVTLLSLLDFDRYDVDLFLFRDDGLFRPLVPPEVNVSGAGRDYLMFDGGLTDALKYFIKNRKWRLAFARVCYALALRKKDAGKRGELAWRHMKTALPRLEKKYYAAIGYLEGTAIYFCADCTSAEKKIGWLHIDYDQIAARRAMDERYFKKLDTLVSVSEQCTQIALNTFPFLRGKTATVANIISSKMLAGMAGNGRVFEDVGGVKIILTVGRLTPQKGIDRAVRACGFLLEKGYDVRWYHIGAGELFDEISALVVEEDAGGAFILLGEKSNPYPYMKSCDVYVQPSNYEGKAIAVDEAKCLRKPIVVTDFPTAREQITDGVNGLVAAMDHASLAKKIMLLLDDASLREKLIENLRCEAVGNESEIEKFYALIEE